jgi:hypothetical protein
MQPISSRALAAAGSLVADQGMNVLVAFEKFSCGCSTLTSGSEGEEYEGAMMNGKNRRDVI